MVSAAVPMCSSAGHGYRDTLHEGGVLVCTLQLAVRHRGVRRDGERDDLNYILLP